MKIELDLEKNKLPEANIQAELYHQCRVHGINCLLEFSIATDKLVTKSGRKKRAKFDALIYDKDYNVLCIVEIKSIKRPKGKPNINTRQLAKYKTFDTPIHMIWNMKMITGFIDYIKTNYPESLIRAPKPKPAKDLTEKAKFSF